MNCWEWSGTHPFNQNSEERPWPAFSIPQDTISTPTTSTQQAHGHPDDKRMAVFSGATFHTPTFPEWFGPATLGFFFFCQILPTGVKITLTGRHAELFHFGPTTANAAHVSFSKGQKKNRPRSGGCCTARACPPFSPGPSQPASQQCQRHAAPKGGPTGGEGKGRWRRAEPGSARRLRPAGCRQAAWSRVRFLARAQCRRSPRYCGEPLCL